MTDIADSDIAIVGIALRVPGAATPEQYWDNLLHGFEARQTYTDEELLARGVSRTDLADPDYVKAGMPLDGVDQFDPEFFGFSPKEAAILDPQHRQFYEVAWEALERAGHPPRAFPGNVGVFGGSGMAAYFAFNVMTNADLVDSVGLFLLRHTGNDKDFLATRVSYAFDLKGPSVNVQTACSTSLVATHLAAQSLLAGECDMALAGGSTVELPHRVGYHYKEGEILSPDGHCRPFDHRSRGTVFGSGVGVVVLRRLADAIADGDHIHAVIKSTAVNNDGSGKVGYLAPSVDGQAAAIAEALAMAGVEADSVEFVECHGTGTPVGDPIEVAALTRAFRETSERSGYCRLGSVKSNIGHLDTAAGVAGLIKAALCVEHGKIPPSLHYEAPNPVIAFDGSPFTVAATLENWQPRGGTPRRAGVNSLGVGGTNAFAVLEQPPTRELPPEDPAPQLLVLSARSRKALDDGGTRLAAWLRAHPEQALADVSYTLLAGREAFEHRRVLAAGSHAEAVSLLENPDARRVYTHAQELERPSVVFMYPGGGAQYFRMGRGLYEREAVFREHMDRGLAVLKSRFGTDLTAIFLADENSRDEVVTELTRPSVQLPLIFLLEYALTHLWQHYGVTPDALMGHSLGENTAACVAGVLSFEDALGLVLLRGQLMDEVPEGGMLAVPMPAEELQPWLCGQLDLAAANSPQLSVASGTAAQLDDLKARLAEQGIEAQRVRINIAAHSRLLEGILERFRAYLESIRLHEPTMPLISNRTGNWLEANRATDPEYWVEHLRNTVLFGDGVETLLAADNRVFLEVGPGVTLGSLVRQNPRAPAQRVFASLRHPEDPAPDDVFFRTVIGRLWAVGVDIAQDKLWAQRRVRVPLPSYPFQHNAFWIEPGKLTAAQSTKDDLRPLRLENPDDWFLAPRWVQQGILDIDDRRKQWLVFHGREPVGETLVRRLRDQGHTVVSVLPGDTFARLDDRTFTIAPEAAGVGYAELAEALKESGLAPDRILHTWLLTWDRSFRPGSTFFHRNQEYGFYSLLHLAQALGKSGLDDNDIHLIVAANGTQKVGGESLDCPDKVTVMGPCAVVPREFPKITCRFVDVESGAEMQTSKPRHAKRNAKQDTSAADSAITALYDELFAAPATDVIAWRSGVRWQRHLGTAKLPLADAVASTHGTNTAAAPSRLKERGVYLITGGLGGIAGVLAEWLARSYRARLVLVGRTPLPNRNDWDDWLTRHPADDTISRGIQRVRELESLGADVRVMAADVTVAERMQEVVAEAREAFGDINGVFHTAGVIRDNLIQLKSQRDIEEVFAAKVYGTLVLDEVFRNVPLGFMVLFSSTSVYIAPQGQIDYVGANAFLNAFADARNGQCSYPVTAINWGIWRDVGMVGGNRQSSDEPAHATILPTRYPLFTQHQSSRDGVTELHVLTGTLSAQEHWIVDEHRLASSEALLPGTSYLELIRAALEEAGFHAPWQLVNLVFENPLFVADGQPREFRIRLRGNEQYWDAQVQASNTGNGWTTCATARVQRDRPEHPAALSLDDIAKRCDIVHETTGGSSALRTRQEDHLKFGPRWRVLKRLDLGSGEALARLALPGNVADDTDSFALHPGLLDIATGCAMDLIPGYAGQDVASHLWAPISYRGFRLFGALTPEIASWIRLHPESRPEDGFVAFDASLTDRDGRVLAEVDRLTLRRIDGALAAPTLQQAESAHVQGEAGAPDRSRRKAQSPAELALQHNVTLGIDAVSGVQALQRLLAAHPVPSSLIVSSLPLPALLRQADAVAKAATASSDTRFSRPQLDSDFEPPRDDLERALADLWGKLLGVEGIGIRDNFFDLGGHSLIAVRLFNELADEWGIDLPMSVLMQSPTIVDLAELLRDQLPDLATETAGDSDSPATAKTRRGPEFRFIVPMHSGTVANATPLFIVSGMFGNVLNLSHMAHLLGEDRPFYALQAQGLYGDEPPHESFEDMANDYIHEVRKLQPHGPYLLGGFSGGGITAYEMARQLIEQGEPIQKLILLDTPVPLSSPVSLIDRMSMFLQDLKRGGLVNKVRARIEWEKQKRQAVSKGLQSNDTTNSFQSQRIGDAFVRAVARYQLQSVPVDVALFRPRLSVRYELSRARRLNSDRRYISEDNLWTPYVASLNVVEVPGTHDSMVLEPNVRVLVEGIRKAVQAYNPNQAG